MVTHFGGRVAWASNDDGRANLHYTCSRRVRTRRASVTSTATEIWTSSPPLGVTRTKGAKNSKPPRDDVYLKNEFVERGGKPLFERQPFELGITADCKKP
jgi:hypothetical protein